MEGRLVTDPNAIADLDGQKDYVPPEQSVNGSLINDPNVIKSLESMPDYSQLQNQQANTQINNLPSQNNLQKYFPEPSLPLGMNIFSGLLGSFLPKDQQQIVNRLPQALTNQPYGLSNKIAANAGSVIPAILTGGESLLGQALAGGAQGAMQAEPGDRWNSAMNNALGTIALGKLVPGIINYLRPVSPKFAASGIQKAHDELLNKAQEGFQKVSSEVNNRNVNQVPTDKDLISKIRDYFPKTNRSNALLDAAESGDYNALRDLQSDLWTRGTKSVGSDLIADRNAGEEMLDLRDEINNHISNHLINTGNSDLDNILNNSRKDYSILRQYYYSHPTIAKLVDPNIRKIPKNIMNVLSENSVTMNRLKDMHPFINSDINSLNMRNNIWKYLKGAGIGAGGLIAAYHLLHPGNPANITNVVSPES